MKRFSIKGAPTATSVLELLSEDDSGFFVRIVRTFEDWEDEKEEYMPRDLFAACLRTGYISELSA